MTPSSFPLTPPSFPRKRESNSYALETVEISKLFGGVRAVDELSVAFPREGMTSVVGPNGSGKSTLVNLLSGVLPLDGGDGDHRRGRPQSGEGTRKPRTTELPGPSRKSGSSTRFRCGTT